MKKSIRIKDIKYNKKNSNRNLYNKKKRKKIKKK